MLKLSIAFLCSISMLYGVDYEYEEGRKIYEKTCLSCHGVDGATNPKMKLVVLPRKLSETILSQQQSYEIIKEGAHFWGSHADIMPSFKSVYNEDELRSVTHYITKAFNPRGKERIMKVLDASEDIKDADPKKVYKTGKKIFLRNCSMCHGIDGSGKSEYVEISRKQKNFFYPYNLSKTLLDEDQIFLYSKYGGKYWGSMKDDMPSWKRKYNDFELRSVARYIAQEIINKQTKD